MRKNINNSEILIPNEIGNIYQKEIMKLPPEQQPLFYESNSKFYINNLLFNNNITNNNCNDTISFNDLKIIFDDKFNYNKNSISNLCSKDNSIYRKTNKKKLLDFNDFKVIFEEKDNNINKSITQINNNILKQTYINNNSYGNKFLEKNLIDKKYNIKNKKHIPSLKNKIIYNKNNDNVYKFGNIIKENGNTKDISYKYSYYINLKYKNFFGNRTKYNINDNGKVKGCNNNNINENNFVFPFYLINKQDLFQNMLNCFNTKDI